MSLRGEYIWDGSYLIGADTEVDDMGHEAYIMSHISGTYGEDMTNALEEEHDRLSQLNNQQLLVDPIYKKLQQEGYDIDDVANLVDKLNRYGIEHTDPELIYDAYQMLKTMHPEQYSTPEITGAMNVLKGGDARYYGVKNYGYTIIRDDNFEVYGWNEKAAKSILNAIYEMAGEELNDPNSEVWDEEITIHDYQNNKSYTMTVRELEENPFKLAATPAALLQSKKHGMQYINPIAAGGSQNWQKQYTSESFSNMNFKLWLENEDEDKIKRLGKQLKDLDLQKYSVLGHGTSKQTAENILKTGLRYSDPNLDRQTIPLFDSQSPIQNQTNNLKSILNWKHKNSKAIVLLGIPNPKEDERGGEQHFQSVWDEIPKEKLTDLNGNPTDKNSFKYIIKPEYIMGYVDTNTATFHPNPNFKPTPLNKKNKWWVEPPSLPRQFNRKIIPQLNTPTAQYSDPDVW
jgi:hypothetical protein